MATAYHHAVSSARRFGGEPEDFAALHEFFDATSKENVGDFRHRALRHHTFGIEQCVLLFGGTVPTTGAPSVPTRLVAEGHVLEDHGRVPTPLDWLSRLAPAPPTDRPAIPTDDQAESSAKRWGGEPGEYLAVHRFFDETAPQMPADDPRHRALRHHTTGVRECEERLGRAMRLSTGRTIPVRWVAERHLAEEFGVLVTAADWLRRIKRERWMADARPLSRELEAHDAVAAATGLAAVGTDVRRQEEER